MTTREGSLEAPTRHPLDWKSPDFHDPAKVEKELERVFEICHGCRRCVNLCTAFPTLFDLVDQSATLEVDGVAKQDYGKVVDQCYLCDMCYMTKCPYVPPHPWNVDFPHLMLRAKAARFHHQGAKLRDRLLTSTDAVGKLATIPVVVQFVNAANKSSLARGLMQKALGVHKDRVLPEYTGARFRSHARPKTAFPVREGKNAPGKVALFSTCYINYNEPGIGHDLLKVLEHNEIPYVLAEKENCCGMPKLEQGDLEAVAKLMERNVAQLAPLAKQGYAILTPVPSCTLMFKQELPLLFPNDENVLAVRDAMFDPFEYLMARKRDGLLKTEFPKPLGKVVYHVPCHSRVQKIGLRTKEGLESVPGTEVTTVERCSGHAGTWGVKKEFHEIALKIGRPVVRQIAETQPDYFTSDCMLAGHHLDEGLARADGRGKAELHHPITLLRKAYGLPD
jgi:glycerol-3-phosphate dehydrogenase subunit C